MSLLVVARTRRSHRLYQLVSESRTAMLREAGELTTLTKIRKRCAVSPSSGASAERQRRRALRLRRGVRLIGGGHRRGGFAGGGASPCETSGGKKKKKKKRMSESSWNRHCRDAEARSAASARKLVSALWQMNKGDDGALEEEEEGIGWDAAAAARRSLDHRRSASLEVGDGDLWLASLLFGSCLRFRLVSENFSTVYEETIDLTCFHPIFQVHTCPQSRTPARPGDRAAQVQDLHNSLTASTELVRVLANVLGPTGALSPTAASLLAALRSELDAARRRARRLAKHHHHGGAGEEEDEHHHHQLRRQLEEEVRAWKARHREKAAAAARLVASELDGERRSRRRAERVGKKLAEALADAEASLRAATRELEREKAARERLEKVCDELARGVAGVEEEEVLRREVDAAREEIERERGMLHVADELREERVRMKLAEARIQFEEKNAAVDRLRQELEACLGNNNSSKERQESPDHHDEHRRSLQLVLASEFGVDGIDRVATDKTTAATRAEDDGGDGEADDGSEGSDIELNMDGNSWSYMTTSRETTAKNAASVHGGSLSDRGTECGGAERSHGTRDALDLHHEWNDGCSDGRASTRDMDEDAERYEAIKNLREQMLAGHGFVFLSQGEGDGDRDRHRQGLMIPHQIEDGGLW
ncbi:hypothetical protein HU200_041852 [Digitaria exilis]|uniref:Uncharacterized protein n=1 Tax=Digitaria exilis TaxID=1010633 RepID=A0A835BEP1_9POAL|nr:hypothetical protein HU200_041852 [Digitaria exilis]